MVRNPAVKLTLCSFVSALSFLFPFMRSNAQTAVPIFSALTIYSSGGLEPVSLTVADLNGDGKPDLVVGNLSCSIGVLLGKGNGTFHPAVSYDTGGCGFPLFNGVFSSVVVADVSGDGKLDIVIANQRKSGENYDGSVGVLLGKGDGTFEPVVTYASGGQFASSLALADINGDGKPDLVLANCAASTSSTTTNCGTENGVLGVLLGNGDGTFRPAQTYSSGAPEFFFPPGVIIADVNDDGRPDLLVSNAGASSGNLAGSIGVLLGNGNGTFQAAKTYPSGGYSAMSLVAADVNGDGNLDLLVGNADSGSIGVLLSNGNGTFQPVQIYAVDLGPFLVLATDVNADGKPDLEAAGTSCPTIGSSQGCHDAVAVLLNNGDGTFQAHKTYPTGGVNGGFAQEWLAIADVNGDGKPDLLAANACATQGICVYTSTERGTIGVLLNNGDGTFQPAVLLDAGGKLASSIAAADLNGDGRPDLVVTDLSGSSVAPSTVTVRMNEAPTSTTLTSSLNPSIYGQKVSFRATVASSGPITPTGQVAFRWSQNGSTYEIGRATLNSEGVAALAKSNLNADVYPLTAIYLGDTTHQRSDSAVLNQVVKETTSSALVSSSQNPSSVGQPVTFTATIISPTVIPTGPVTFMAGKAVLGISQLSARKATFTTSALPVGSTVVTAIYYGDSNIAKSSASVTQVVH